MSQAPLEDNVNRVQHRIQQAEKLYQRQDSVLLLAVGKTKPASLIHQAYELGQRHFGENYLQEALQKIAQLKAEKGIIWHFIGPIQSNKTRDIAQNFQWVHSVDRLKIAQRLSDQRDPALGNLNICLQVNISDEASKSGVDLPQLAELVEKVACLPNLILRGLMAIPAAQENFNKQREPFKLLAQTMHALNDKFSLQMDTLSMGMTDDLEAAIAEGATIVRVGTALFGGR